MDELSGKVALITGSAGGIGLGVASACVRAGMRVMLADIDMSESAKALVGLRRMSPHVAAAELDVTDRDGWARLEREVADRFGPVQLLVNNAGVSTLGVRFEDVAPALWDRVIGTNLTGAYNGVHTFLDGMRRAGGGHIVNMSSMAGLYGVPTLGPYCASKFGLIGMSEVLRLELADWGIGVSVVCPGSVHSRLWRTSRAARGLVDADVPPVGAAAQSANPDAMNAEEVGRRVLQAVVANELYVFTHPDLRGRVATRHEELMRAFDLAELTAGRM